jgi:Flp pilus assembly pilin Flp
VWVAPRGWPHGALILHEMSASRGTIMLGQLALRLYLGIQNIVTSSQDEEGQTLAEYGLILAVVAVAVVVAAAVAFKDGIISAFNSATQ